MNSSVKSKPGFSILEAIVSLSLLATLLAMVAVLSNQYSRITEAGFTKDRMMYAVEQALRNLRLDIEASLAAPARTPYPLTLRRVHPNDFNRYTPVKGVPWDPWSGPRTIQVGYMVSSEGLVRVVDNSNAIVVASGVTGFDFDPGRAGLVVVFITTVDPKGRLITIQSNINRWLP